MKRKVGRGCVLMRVRWMLSLAIALLAPATPLHAAPGPIHYAITLESPSEHLVRVVITLPPGATQRQLQLPVWNATYQIRDFAQNVLWLRAQNSSGAQLPEHKLNKSRWQVDDMAQGGAIEYEILADLPGPFGAQFNAEHAFFNFAEILMYPTDARDGPMTVSFDGLPKHWRLASPLADDSGEIRATDYDALVDSPVELGQFREALFTENGGQYRIVVHAAPEDYDLSELSNILRKIVHAETTWMEDRPFQKYMFLYHFPPDRGDGGMEHAYSTAIELSARSLKADPDQLASMTAHEFFHLWNVKRIRPQTIAPPDYTKENYTRALWFSEGVTSTVEQYALLECGLIDEKAFLRNLSEEITALQNRPARLTQSAEESSLDAWLEKYSQYRQPRRSISYYNKGFLLGILLDLEMRKSSGDEASLRELFQYLNQTYAKKERFFDDSDSIRKAAEAVSGADLSQFFQKYVAGTEEIPYDDFLSWVGLRVAIREKVSPDPGFRVARNFETAPAVVSVAPDGEAARAGLAVGESILTLDGAAVGRDFEPRIAGHAVGDVVRVRVRAANGIEREFGIKLAASKSLEYEVVEAEKPTLLQLLHRKNWFAIHEAKVTRAGLIRLGTK